MKSILKKDESPSVPIFVVIIMIQLKLMMSIISSSNGILLLFKARKNNTI